jgi:hypothetical protein
MELLKAKVHKLEGYANPPTMQILVDKIPEFEEIEHQVVSIGDHTAYFGEKDGFVHYCVHNARNESGFGGRLFKLKTFDGIVDVRGPWSSNSHAMRQLGFTDSTEVSMTDDPEAFERGYTFMAGTVTVDFFRKCLVMADAYAVRDARGNLEIAE